MVQASQGIQELDPLYKGENYALLRNVVMQLVVANTCSGIGQDTWQKLGSSVAAAVQKTHGLVFRK